VIGRADIGGNWERFLNMFLNSRVIQGPKIKIAKRRAKRLRLRKE